MQTDISVKHPYGAYRTFIHGQLGSAIRKAEIRYSLKNSYIDDDGLDRNIYTLYDIDPEDLIILKIHFPDIKVLT